jgi:hypothetical protein
MFQSFPSFFLSADTATRNHTRKERLTDAASSTQQSELVFHNSVSAERLWKTAVPYWDLVPNPPSLPPTQVYPW